MSGTMRMAADRPKRLAARFHGSKHTMGPWIVAHLPGNEEHDVYVEPFCGMANVLFVKERSRIEAINDLDSDVVNFFRVLREQEKALIRLIDYTPFAWEEWKLSFEPADDPLERARRFYCRAYMSIAGPTSSSANPGFRRQKKFSRGRDGRSMMTTAANTFANVSHLEEVARRLKGVTIENENAMTLMGRYDSPSTVFYVDPPYYPDTRVRNARSAYRHEMTEADHEALLTVLNGLGGMVALSGYRVKVYDDVLAGWERHDRRVRVNSNGYRVESLWLNPAAVEAVERGRCRAREQRDLPHAPEQWQQSFFWDESRFGTFRNEEE